MARLQTDMNSEYAQLISRRRWRYVGGVVLVVMACAVSVLIWLLGVDGALPGGLVLHEDLARQDRFPAAVAGGASNRRAVTNSSQIGRRDPGELRKAPEPGSRVRRRTPADVFETIVIGVVRNKATDVPIRDAIVRIVTDSLSDEDRTNHNGEYRVTVRWDIDRRFPLLVVTCAGFRATQVGLGLRDFEGRPTLIRRDIGLTKGAAIRGVAYSLGKPAVGAVVVPRRSGGGKNARLPPSWTNAAGEFYISGTPGERVSITINHGEYGAAERESRFAISEEMTDLGRVELLRRSMVVARLVDPQGLPLENLRVSVSSAKASILDGRVGAAVWRAKTGPGGVLQLYGMREGDIVLRIDGARHLGRRAPAFRLATQAETQVRVVNLCRARVNFRDRSNALMRAETLIVELAQSDDCSCEDLKWERIYHSPHDLLLPPDTRWVVRASGFGQSGQNGVFANEGEWETSITIHLQ